MKTWLSAFLDRETEAAPLAVFRISFGLIMFLSMMRFWGNGWIEKLYLRPNLFFSYYGFEWVKPLGDLTYLLFLVCGLSALFMALGLWYRISAIIFFFSFTYIELMDMTTYLNHYYLISLLSLLLIFLPANAYFSIDACRDPKKAFQRIPSWCSESIKILLVLVYFYAGLAKLNSDWLLEAMPLKIWLPAKQEIPLLGGLLQFEWVSYAFSWSGMLFDLAIPFLLLYRPTRGFAYVMVILFHVLTGFLFPIGMFPYIMILNALLFFHPSLHHRILDHISRGLNLDKSWFDNGNQLVYPLLKKKVLTTFFGLFLAFQFLFPWRYLLYPGELFWTEEGFRFSWRVMLMEKAGYAQFRVVDLESGKKFYVDNDAFLTPFQEKQMAFQPDFILQYAHHLKRHFSQQGYQQIEIYVDSYVALNGRKSVPFIDPAVNLLSLKESFQPKTFILPFNDTIKGL